jgi:single-stranded DNA-binding protein
MDPVYKERTISASINRVTLMGQLSKYGLEVRYTPSDTACASFTLIVSEQGQDGKVHDIFVPCEC